MYFYELHEGDDEVFSDLLLVREDEMAPDVFFGVVQEIRRRVQDSFQEDTLIEAIAVELERDHDFIYISDDRLTAAAHVSSVEGENSLTDLYGDADDSEGPGDEDEDLAGFRTLVAEFKGDKPDSLN